jgi:hypothetical protein
MFVDIQDRIVQMVETRQALPLDAAVVEKMLGHVCVLLKEVVNR